MHSFNYVTGAPSYKSRGNCEYFHDCDNHGKKFVNFRTVFQKLLKALICSHLQAELLL